MGVGFEAVREDIDESAAAISETARGVKTADPSDHLSIIASALPGSESAAAATSLAGTWTDRFKAWSDDTEAHAETRRGSAASYTRTDYENANQFSSVGPVAPR